MTRRPGTPRRTGRSLLPMAAVVGVAVVLVAAAGTYAAFRPVASGRTPVIAVATPANAPSAIAPAAKKLAQRADSVVTLQTEQRRKATASVTATASAPAFSAKAVPPPLTPLTFDTARAMTHIRKFSEEIGVRVGGTGGEWKAVAYARDYLTSLGYDVAVTEVPLPNGRISHNVIARKKDAKGPIVVLGGHIDSKSPAPGADDNATGCGTILELARDFAKAKTLSDVRFVLFGTEEIVDGNSDHHHFGSRAYVKALPASERSRFAAMVSIDMIGYGPDFRVRTMGVGTRAVADALVATSKKTKAPLAYLRDPGATGWSDHEPFERAGLPAAWLEWRDNPNAHTSRDTYGRISSSKIRTTGVLVREWLASLSSDDLARFVRL